MLKKIINWFHPNISNIDDDLKNTFIHQSILSVKILAFILLCLGCLSLIILYTIPTARTHGFTISAKFFILSFILILTYFSPYKKKISSIVLLLVLFFLISDNIFLQLQIFTIHKTQLGLFIASICFVAFTFLPYRPWVVALFGIFSIIMIFIFSIILNVDLNPYKNTSLFWLVLQFGGLSLITFFFRSAIFNMQLNLYYSKTKINDIQEELNDIKILLAKEESNNLEYKSSFKYDYKTKTPNSNLKFSILKTIAAFLNSNEGSLIIGVDDKKNILGLENDYKTFKKKDSDGFQLAIIQEVTDKIGPEYCQNLTFNFVAIENKEICIIKIKKSAKPAYISNKKETFFYIRTGNSTQLLDTKKAVEYITNNF